MPSRPSIRPAVAEAPADLIGRTRAELVDLLAGLGLPRFRAQQIWQWIYHRGVTDFADMTNLAKPVRAQLAETFTISRPAVSQDLTSVDGTRKWLLRFADGHEAEMVYIPMDADSGTLCVSSQVGCVLNCRFCHTGTQPFVRNLTPAEIVGQIMLARDALGEWPTPNEGRQICNIVLMGMGEPLYNLDNLAIALPIIMDGEGIAISRRRITLSTAGLVPQMHRCGAELGVLLAVSLHAVTDEVRDHLVPLNRKYPIAELMRACRDYPGLRNAQRITFEYVMLRDVNDSPADARELVRLLRGIPAKVNLIPFNPWPGSEFECATPAAIDRFSSMVFDAGIAAPVREPRGRDILAACGQLKSASQRTPSAA